MPLSRLQCAPWRQLHGGESVIVILSKSGDCKLCFKTAFKIQGGRASSTFQVYPRPLALVRSRSLPTMASPPKLQKQHMSSGIKPKKEAAEPRPSARQVSPDSARTFTNPPLVFSSYHPRIKSSSFTEYSHQLHSHQRMYFRVATSHHLKMTIYPHRKIQSGT